MEQKWIHKIPNNSLDFIRLILAGIVVVAHFIVLSKNETLQPFLPIFNTTVAVMGFFILSGLLVTASYMRSKSLKDYFIKRAKRLLPAYIFVVVACAFLLSTQSSLSFTDYFTHKDFYKYLLANLSFMNFLQPTLPGVFENNPVPGFVNGALWTIKIEVAFYLILPFLLYITKKLQVKWKINLFFILLYIGSLVYAGICDYIKQQYGIGMMEELKRQLPGQMHYFSIGCLAYFNFDWLMKNLKYLFPIGFILVLEYFLLHSTYIWGFGLAFILLGIGFLIPQLNKLTKNGDISYGLYIIHFPIAQLLISKQLQLNIYLQFILFLCIVFILAWLSWHFLEQKFLKRKSH